MIKSRTNTLIDSERTPQDSDFSRFMCIEQSQKLLYYDKPNNKPQTQPWIHVGIKPCPSISLGEESNSSVSNIQGYFEIEATMTVEYGFPTQFPHMSRTNVSPTSQVYAVIHNTNESKTHHLGLQRYM